MSHVLLIEPDRPLARIYRLALQRKGYRVSHAPTAQTALHAADHQRPDLIILDLQLAGHNGIEFLYEFRSYPEWQDVPIVLHTMVPPTALKESQDILADLGVRLYLYKPTTSVHDLLINVQTVLDYARV